MGAPAQVPLLHLLHLLHLRQRLQTVTTKIPRMDASLMRLTFKSKVFPELSAHHHVVSSSLAQPMSQQELQHSHSVLCRMPPHIRSIVLSFAAPLPMMISVVLMLHARASRQSAFALTTTIR